RTGRAPEWQGADGRTVRREIDRALAAERMAALLARGRLFEVKDLARGSDPVWSEPAREALEEALGETPESR
ncbi:MAG: hypothetical protein MUC63_03460, partial [Planctomycetes bacterium]|nr:hypothetical protein [Planctomycetota bacterium]